VRHRRFNGRDVVASMGALLAPAGYHEQRVVEGDPEADEADQELDDHADAGEGREAEHERER
jgi:hypothetical protein